jgi:5-methylcytosine-specific restriction protein A
MMAKRGQKGTASAILFKVRQVYNRTRDIHQVFRGQQYGGISTPTAHPFIFLFTGESGKQSGYQDGWGASGGFLYTGEGQVGDMKFVSGNKAIRDHYSDGKDLLLFESLGSGGDCRYLGLFGCGSYEYRDGEDRNHNRRQMIVFHLTQHTGAVSSTDVPPSNLTLEELRKRADAATKPPSGETRRNANRTYHQRSIQVKQYVFARANGKCESCKKRAPFTRPNGTPYLEAHHIRRLSDDGWDRREWVAALCPNCHREVHSGVDKENRNSKLQKKVAAKERRIGVP